MTESPDRDDAEFVALIERQSRFVFRVAYAILRNSHDAEDAAQETFLKLFRNRGWRQLDNERAFLARAAWRTALDRQEQRDRREFRGRAGVFTDSGSEAHPSPAPGPEQLAIAASRHAFIHKLIDALPEELRQPLALSAVDEMNSREIGEILGVPEGTVRTRIQRARLLLKQKLAALEVTPYAR